VFYESFQAPWDIGRPQPAIATLVERGLVKGRVLDVGCGTGEHALLSAAHGHEAWGVDESPAAIGRAREKATARALTVDFRAHDALDIASLGTTFETILDVGLFHTFSDRERVTYAEQIARTLSAGGSLFVLCFSELEPPWGGPRRVTERELVETFSTDHLTTSFVHSTSFLNASSLGKEAHAWLARVVRA
jgi:cyclopropane fatty-acyl-phospholipid synthase-like methyltransferase